MWETATGRPCSKLEDHLHRVTAVTFSPDGQLVASASNVETVRVREIVTGRHRSELEGYSDEARTMVLLPDGQLIASVSDDKTVGV